MKLMLRLLSILFLISIFGCATTPSTNIKTGIPGIYHRVGKGQTLWSISKLYGLELDELVRVNNLSSSSSIQAGQILFIPKEGGLKSSSNFSEDFIWPLKGSVISRFNQLSENVTNKGIDIKANYGSFIGAARSGKVTFLSDSLKGFGRTMIIQHDENFSTVYARNSEILVKLGDNVKQGQLIAKVGTAGRNNVPYLHFEIRKKHMPQNPYYYLPQ